MKMTPYPKPFDIRSYPPYDDRRERMQREIRLLQGEIEVWKAREAKYERSLQAIRELCKWDVDKVEAIFDKYAL